jgi:hypothetical protein
VIAGLMAVASKCFLLLIVEMQRLADLVAAVS